jgi:hypothetical protein
MVGFSLFTYEQLKKGMQSLIAILEKWFEVDALPEEDQSDEDNPKDTDLLPTIQGYNSCTLLHNKLDIFHTTSKQKFFS